MKTFYTVRDIEDMHAAGVVEIQIHDDVVLTDVAREKAIALGMHLIMVDHGSVRNQRPSGSRMAAAGQPKAAPTVGAVQNRPPGPPVSNLPPQTDPSVLPADQVMKIKAAVVAKLGTDKYNDLLDKLIPQVMSQLKK